MQSINRHNLRPTVWYMFPVLRSTVRPALKVFHTRPKWATMPRWICSDEIERKKNGSIKFNRDKCCDGMEGHHAMLENHSYVVVVMIVCVRACVRILKGIEFDVPFHRTAYKDAYQLQEKWAIHAVNCASVTTQTRNVKERRESVRMKQQLSKGSPIPFQQIWKGHYDAIFLELILKSFSQMIRITRQKRLIWKFYWANSLSCFNQKLMYANRQ